MNTILHIVKKDLRVGGSSILIFMGLLVLNVIAQSPLMPEGTLATQFARNILPLSIFLVLLTCVVMAVLEDPVSGTSAFWLTRPPRAGALLAAKALLIGSMVFAYLVGQVVILGINGGFRLTPYLVGGFIVGMVPVVVAFFAASSMASDPTRFFVTLAIGLAVLGVLAVVGNYLADVFLPGTSIPTVRNATLAASGKVVTGGLALVAAVGLACHQYRTRRTVRTGILGVIVAVALVAVFVFWRIDFFQSPPISEESEKALGLDRFQPELRADSAGLVISTYEDPSGEEHVRLLLNAKMDTIGLEEGWILKSLEGKAELVTRGGRKLDGNIPPNNMGVGRGQAVLMGFRPAGQGSMDEGEPGVQITLLDLPEADYKALGRTTVSGTLALRLVMARRDIVAEIPLEAGAEVRAGGESWRLKSASPRFNHLTTTRDGVTEHKQVLGGLDVDLDVCAPDLWLQAAIEGSRPPQYGGDMPLVLINRDRRELVSRGGGGGSFNAGQPGLPVARNSLNVQFNASAGLDSAWLDGAVLALVDDQELTIITRTLRVDEVPVIQD